MRLTLGWLLLFLGLSAPRVASAQEVVMYGASWCGPCRAVRQYLDGIRAPYRYQDVDQPEAFVAFSKEGGGGIPLLKIGGDTIRGADLGAIGEALSKIGVIKGGAAPAPTGESYGGHRPDWWQQQFRDLRAQLAQLDQQLGGNKGSLFVDDQERGERLKQRRATMAASLDQLENDASKVSLPRKYRE